MVEITFGGPLLHRSKGVKLVLVESLMHKYHERLFISFILRMVNLKNKGTLIFYDKISLHRCLSRIPFVMVGILNARG